MTLLLVMRKQRLSTEVESQIYRFTGLSSSLTLVGESVFRRTEQDQWLTAQKEVPEP